MKKYFAHITVVSLIFWSCNNELKDLQNLSKKELHPSGVTDSVWVKYTDSAVIKAELFAVKMLDYNTAKYPFNHFPEGVEVVIYDENKNKNFVEADQATSYSKTGIIDLRGHVKITSHDGKIMETQQLYYDQKSNWFFTEYYFKVTDPNKSFFEGIGIDFDQNFRIIDAQQNRAEFKDIKK